MKNTLKNREIEENKRKIIERKKQNNQAGNRNEAGKLENT